MQAGEPYRVRWMAGAFLVALLTLDAFAFLTSAEPLAYHAGWFVLGILTALAAAAAALTQPRKPMRQPAGRP